MKGGGKVKGPAAEQDGLLGVAGHVFGTGQVVNVPEAYKEPLFDPKVDRPECISKVTTLVAAPISAPDGSVRGVLSAFNKAEEAPFGRLDEQFLRAFSPIAYTALLNVQRHGDARTATQQARALLNGVGGVLNAVDIGMLGGHVRDNIAPVLRSEKAFLFVLSRDKASLSLIVDEVTTVI